MDALTVTTYTADGGRSLREFLHPVRITRGLWSHRDLTLQTARREAMGRYRSSRLGLLWSLITPLISLTVYTLVFSGILKARFTSNPSESHASFVLYLFSGMLVYTVFAEVVGRFLMRMNPLAETLEQARRVTIQGTPPDWGWWLASLLMSGVFCLLGYAVFMKSKRGFADVL